MMEDQQETTARTKRDRGTPTVARALQDGTLVELLYRPAEHRTLFCVAKDGEWREEASVLANG